MDKFAENLKLAATLMATLTNSTGPTPAALGFAMPAEWEKHEATWLGWPHHPTDWPDKLDTIRWVYGEMVRKIAPGEIVRMLVNTRTEEKLARRYLTRAGADVGRVEFIVHPTNRGWTRDSGPVLFKSAITRTSGSFLSRDQHDTASKATHERPRSDDFFQP